MPFRVGTCLTGQVRSPFSFRARGNKYANWLELMSSDLDMLRQVKGAFPTDFRMEVQTKEGTV